MKPFPYPRWIAHRGAGTLAPENTMAAFALGARKGWRMFECDVKLSADEVAFLLHDDNLDRTTNGQGLAARFDWSALAQLDAGQWHSPAHAGEPLCTLASLSAWCLDRDLRLNIEIKPTPGLEWQTGWVVAKLAAALWHNASLPPLLTSFQPESLRAAAQAAPDLPRGLLLEEWLEQDLAQVAAQGYSALVCHYPLWTPQRLEAAAQAGLWRMSYTVNEAEVAAWLFQEGHEAIITDAIDQFDPAA